jgi:hypothetical protein
MVKQAGRIKAVPGGIKEKQNQHDQDGGRHPSVARGGPRSRTAGRAELGGTHAMPLARRQFRFHGPAKTVKPIPARGWPGGGCQRRSIRRFGYSKTFLRSCESPRGPHGAQNIIRLMGLAAPPGASITYWGTAYGVFRGVSHDGQALPHPGRRCADRDVVALVNIVWFHPAAQQH